MLFFCRLSFIYSKAKAREKREKVKKLEESLRLLCTFRGVSRASDVARPI